MKQTKSPPSLSTQTQSLEWAKSEENSNWTERLSKLPDDFEEHPVTEDENKR